MVKPALSSISFSENHGRALLRWNDINLEKAPLQLGILQFNIRHILLIPHTGCLETLQGLTATRTSIAPKVISIFNHFDHRKPSNPFDSFTPSDVSFSCCLSPDRCSGSSDPLLLIDILNEEVISVKWHFNYQLPVRPQDYFET